MTTVLHDFMLVRGGAERLVSTLARGLDSPLVTGFISPEVATWGDSRLIHALGGPVLGTLPRYLVTAHRFATIDPTRLDNEATIYSGVLAPLAVWRQKGGRKIHYCHSPPRFIYDLHEFYLDQLGPPGRIGLKAFAAWYRPRYERAIRAMDVVIANSQNVANRLERYLGVTATVIPPPIDTEQFRWIEAGDYFLSLARLEDYKRVDQIIEAFRRMPHQRLIVGSGGAKEAQYRKLATGCDNISFTSWIDDARLADLIGRCRAALYLPRDEDFGMSPLEAMAAGKPVIGVAEGGLLETIIEGQTGLLLPSPPSVEDIVRGVTQLNQNRVREMRIDCEERAMQFSEQTFIDRFRLVIS